MIAPASDCVQVRVSHETHGPPVVYVRARSALSAFSMSLCVYAFVHMCVTVCVGVGVGECGKCLHAALLFSVCLSACMHLCMCVRHCVCAV
jgi:hypothetical protein